MSKILNKLKNTYDSFDYQKSLLFIISNIIMIISGIVLFITRFQTLLGNPFFIAFCSTVLLSLILAPVVSLLLINFGKLNYATHISFLPSYFLLLSVLFISGGFDSFVLPMIIVLMPFSFYSLNKILSIIICSLTLTLITADVFFNFSESIYVININSNVLINYKLAMFILSTVCIFIFITFVVNRYKKSFEDNLKIQQNLRKRNAELSSIFSAYPDLLIRLNSECKIVNYYSNSTIESKFHLKKKRDEELLNLVSKRDIELLKEFLLKAINDSTTEKMEFLLENSNQEQDFYEIRLVPINKKEVIGIIREVTNRKKAEKELIEFIKEKETLVKEIHHRVKNNMQLIVSLISLQIHYINNNKMCIYALKQSQKRVIAMGLIHNILYKTESLDKMIFKEYIDALMSQLFADTQKSNVKLKIDIDKNICFNMDTSIPLGLIINEIVSNSLNYAFKSIEKSPLIVISLNRGKSGKLILTVKDNGSGLPSEFLDKENITTMGLDVIYTLTDQLDSTIFVDNTNGTCYTLELDVPIFYAENVKNNY